MKYIPAFCNVFPTAIALGLTLWGRGMLPALKKPNSPGTFVEPVAIGLQSWANLFWLKDGVVLPRACQRHSPGGPPSRASGRCAKSPCLGTSESNLDVMKTKLRVKSCEIEVGVKKFEWFCERKFQLYNQVIHINPTNHDNLHRVFLLPKSTSRPVNLTIVLNLAANSDD